MWEIFYLLLIYFALTYFFAYFPLCISICYFSCSLIYSTASSSVGQATIHFPFSSTTTVSDGYTISLNFLFSFSISLKRNESRFIAPALCINTDSMFYGKLNNRFYLIFDMYIISNIGGVIHFFGALRRVKLAALTMASHLILIISFRTILISIFLNICLSNIVCNK